MTKVEFPLNVRAVISTISYDVQDVEVMLPSSNAQTVALKDQTNIYKKMEEKVITNILWVNECKRTHPAVFG